VSLQAALPRELYVDDAAWARERERVLFTTWACVGRVDDLGLDAPGRLAVVDVSRPSASRFFASWVSIVFTCAGSVIPTSMR